MVEVVDVIECPLPPPRHPKFQELILLDDAIKNVWKIIYDELALWFCIFLQQLISLSIILKYGDIKGHENLIYIWSLWFGVFVVPIYYEDCSI